MLMSHVMQGWPRRHRISVDHYYRMAEAGLFDGEARVELIEGEIVDMPPIGSRHAGKASRLADVLRDAVGGSAIVRMQSPVRLDASTEVQPDIAVVKLRDDYYESRHPGPADVLLLVEVSGATLRYDLDVKTPLYARHGIPELWVVDLQADLIHFRSAPVGERYSAESSRAKPAFTQIASLPGIGVDLRTLFGGEPH
jgi:Uma2 family endonuclease